MVVVHGSSGVLQNEWEWAKRLNELGVATFVIDNFTGRGVTETATDQSRLSPSADAAGALAALRLLATHPAIDPQADRRDRLLARRVRRDQLGARADPPRGHR